MQIFVINLEKDIVRRASISRQLGDLGVRFEFVPGVLGAALSSKELALNYDDRKAKWRMARSLVPAEIGCALSHVNVYRLIIERGIPCALVLEDDVLIPPWLDGLLQVCEGTLTADRPEVWLLSPAEGQSGDWGRQSLGPDHVVLPYTTGYYASSYILTRNAAQALLTELHPIGDVADCWNRLNRYRVVDLFVVNPAVIHQDQERFGSSTTEDYRATISTALSSRLMYKLRRARNIVGDSVYAPYRRRFRPYPGLRLPRLPQRSK